mgnify:CR=1 FL=1
MLSGCFGVEWVAAVGSSGDVGICGSECGCVAGVGSVAVGGLSLWVSVSAVWLRRFFAAADASAFTCSMNAVAFHDGGVLLLVCCLLICECNAEMLLNDRPQPWKKHVEVGVGGGIGKSEGLGVLGRALSTAAAAVPDDALVGPTASSGASVACPAAAAASWIAPSTARSSAAPRAAPPTLGASSAAP